MIRVTDNQASAPRSILLVRLGSMGDIIHSLPMAAALRLAFPDCELGWAVDERWAELLCAPAYPRMGERGPQRPLVDRVFGFQLRNWRRHPLSPKTIRQLRDVVGVLRTMSYPLVLDMQGSIKSAVVAHLARGERILGFDNPWERGADAFYTRRIEAVPLTVHMVERNLSLAEAVTGEPAKEPCFELPHCPVAEAWADDFLSRQRIERFALLNPGAGWGAKQWPTERFAEIAKELAAMGVAALVNFGPGEQDLVEEVARLSGGAARPLPCTLSQLIALARRARLAIGGDTGPLHLASALGVPVVGLYGPTNPGRNGPRGSRAINLRHPAAVTNYSQVEDDHEGLLAISVEEVMAAARLLLEN